MSRLSVVLPAYNEEQILAKTCRTLKEILSFSEIEYELVFVDDGSSDKTWNVIEKVSKEDRNISGIHFSRNFGKEAAIIAGLAQASGDAVAVMDCDLQHPPETLVKMFLLWRQGFEVIEGVKKSRGKESRIHGKSAGFFYRIMSGATGFDMKNASDFKLLDRKAVESVLSMPERNMFFRAASSWVGFKSTSVYYERHERIAGESHYPLNKMLALAFDGITSLSIKPIRMITCLGSCIAILSFCGVVWSIVMALLGKTVAGWASMVCIVAFIGGIQLVCLGVLGEYIGKIYLEVKHRPRYIISCLLYTSPSPRDA